MTARVKRLYRVTAGYADGFVDQDGGTQVRYVRTWHYQDKRAAHHRVRVCESGLPGGEGVPPLQAAEWVHLEESEPVVWPASQLAKAGAR